ncbi:MAG: hypothetical protein AB7J40_00575 [Candidatus Altimarinota bacterium]
MKKFLFLFALTFSTALISACSSSATPAASILEEGKIDKTVQKEEDHHEGETNVAPHDDNPITTEEHNDEGTAPHDDNVTSGTHDDEGTAPHGHDPVQPHDDSDQPPHRH